MDPGQGESDATHPRDAAGDRGGLAPVALTTAPAGPDDHLIGRIRILTLPCQRLLRLSRGPDQEPWFAHDALHRFDDPHGRAGHPGTDRFGVLYAAERIDTAFAESVIHDGSLFDRKLGAYSVAASRVRQRQIVTFKRRHGDAELRLADLCGENLKALGLNADLITGDDYRACQAWARKIHDDPRELDGIAFVRHPRRRGA